MINNVKPGYVNPLSMMGSSKKQEKPFCTEEAQTVEKRKKALEAEKQSIQNSLLLMKGTSGDVGSSKENIELLEKKLEKITKEIEKNRQKSVETVTVKGEQVKENGRFVMHNHFDRYEKAELSKEGQDHFQYQVKNGTQAAFSDKNLDLNKTIEEGKDSEEK